MVNMYTYTYKCKCLYTLIHVYHFSPIINSLWNFEEICKNLQEIMEEFVMDFMTKERVVNKSRNVICKPLYELQENKIICANEELAKELFDYLKNILKNDNNN